MTWTHYKALWIWLLCFFGFANKRMARANGNLLRFGTIMDSPEKGHSWMELDQHNIDFVKIRLGPSLSFPQIKQILKFIQEYKKKVIIELAGDPWKAIHDKPIDLIRAYEDWLVSLLNNFQFPSNIHFIQLPSVALENEMSDYDYEFFFNKINSIKNRISPVNRFLVFTNPTFDEKYLIKDDYYNKFFCRSLTVDSKSYKTKNEKAGLFWKLKWSVQYFKLIKSLFVLESQVKGKVCFSNFKFNQSMQSIADIHAVYYICQKVLKDKFHSLAYTSQGLLRTGDKDIYLALRSLHDKN